MAHLWVKTGVSEWGVLPLDTDRVDLDDRVLPRAGWSDWSAARGRLRRTPDRTPRPAGASLHRSAAEGRETWAVLALPWGVTVNGLPVPAGLRVLQDRDEILVAGFEQAYFSTERLTHIEPSPTSIAPLVCPRCRQPIADATPSVCCPACGVWHHQAPALECWTYADRCATCPHPTRLDAGYQWTPEGL